MTACMNWSHTASSSNSLMHANALSSQRTMCSAVTATVCVLCKSLHDNGCTHFYTERLDPAHCLPTWVPQATPSCIQKCYWHSAQLGSVCSSDCLLLSTAGPVSLRYQVHNLTLALQDVGGNSLPLPAGSFFVLIDALPGSSARVSASQGGAKQLPVSRTGNQLKVAPFLVVSTAAGQGFAVNLLMPIAWSRMLVETKQ